MCSDTPRDHRMTVDEGVGGGGDDGGGGGGGW